MATNSDILLALLSERYHASHKMRERSANFTYWALGYLFALGTWIALNGNDLSQGPRVSLTVIIIAATAITLIYISDIKRGFNKNWEVLVKIEDELGCFEKGALITDDVLHPESYKTPQQAGLRGHFNTTILLLIATATALIFVAWSGGA